MTHGAAAHPPVDCQAVVRQLWDWLDDELDPAQWAAIQEHLALCTGCREHVAFARSFLDHVKEPPRDVAALVDLRERLRAAMREGR